MWECKKKLILDIKRFGKYKLEIFEKNYFKLYVK